MTLEITGCFYTAMGNKVKILIEGNMYKYSVSGQRDHCSMLVDYLNSLRSNHFGHPCEGCFIDSHY